MTHPRDYLPALDRIEAALEASCGALITLESLGCGATDGVGDTNGLQEHIGRAIRALRTTIDELRAAQSDGAGALALGFVLKGPAGVRGAGPPAGQSKPRRTA
jgi:hypothetical protein